METEIQLLTLRRGALILRYDNTGTHLRAEQTGRVLQNGRIAAGAVENRRLYDLAEHQDIHRHQFSAGEREHSHHCH